MFAYQFRQEIPATHRITIELPHNAPAGEQAQIIVLFPEQQARTRPEPPRFTTMAEFAAWVQTQPPSTRTTEEVERQVQEERDSWE